MNTVKFREDLSRGGFGERVVARLLEKAGVRSFDNESGNLKTKAEWDLMFYLGGNAYFAEVKYEPKEARTGNVAVEYYNPKLGRPSGIGVTTSELWFEVLQEPLTVWVTRTADLRQFTDQVPPLKDPPGAGDGNTAVKVYARAPLFASIFHRVDDLDPQPLARLLRELLGETDGSQQVAKAA